MSQRLFSFSVPFILASFSLRVTSDATLWLLASNGKQSQKVTLKEKSELFFQMLPSGNIRDQGEIRSRIKSFSERYPDVNQAALLAQGIKAACIGNRFDIIPVLFEIYFEFKQGPSSVEDDSSSPTCNDSAQDTADRNSIESQSRDLRVEFNDTAYSSGEIAFNVESCTLAFRQFRCDFRAINLYNNNIEIEILPRTVLMTKSFI